MSLKKRARDISDVADKYMKRMSDEDYITVMEACRDIQKVVLWKITYVEVKAMARRTIEFGVKTMIVEEVPTFQPHCSPHNWVAWVCIYRATKMPTNADPSTFVRPQFMIAEDTVIVITKYEKM
jgi:hypothetical protein